MAKNKPIQRGEKKKSKSTKSADSKFLDSLQISDYVSHPVWEIFNEDDSVIAEEVSVRPVETLPVDHLDLRLVETRITLANGTLVWAAIDNVRVGFPQAIEQFLCLSVERNEVWFSLSRYFDMDYTDNGPEALARFLGLDLDAVFPISYDITQYVKGDPAQLRGKILKNPRKKLSQGERNALGH